MTLLAYLIALGEIAVLGARPALLSIIHVSVAGVEWLPLWPGCGMTRRRQC